MELNCTSASVPVKSPKCGSLNTRISGLLLFDLFKGGDAKNSSETYGKKQKK